MFYVEQLISQAGRSNSSRRVKDSWPCRAAASIRKLSGRNVLLKDQTSESNEVMDNSVLCSHQGLALKRLFTFIRQ